MNKKRTSAFSTICILMTISLLINCTMPVNAAIIPRASGSSKVKSVTITVPSCSTLVLKKGKTYTLKTKVTADKKVSKKVTYTSSNKKIATVNKNGKIKAIKNGNAKITVKCMADKKKKASLKIIVGTPITNVTFEKSSLDAYEGETITLQATVTPQNASYKKLSFKSDNDEIASVTTDGTVTCKKEGAVTITAMAQDGSKKKTVCKLTIQKKPVPEQPQPEQPQPEQTTPEQEQQQPEQTGPQQPKPVLPPRAEPTEPVISDELLALEAKAEARKQELIKMPDSLRKSDELIPGETYTGTAYYLSSIRGNDDNDGLTPDTPKASLTGFYNTKMEEGDALLLECGSQWYIDWSEPDIENWDVARDRFRIPDGITLSSYGTGPRPIIRGDLHQEDVMSEDNWILYEADATGRKIWKYSKQISDPGVIVFDDGDSWAEQILQKLDLQGNSIMDDGTPLTVSEALKEDLTFIHIPDKAYIPKNNTSTISGTFGDLYLRCDSGNPAVIYNEIAIPHTENGLQIYRTGVIENLDIRYFAGGGIELDDYGRTTWKEEGNKYVENCIISWCGGFKVYPKDTVHPSEDFPDFKGFDYYTRLIAGGAIQTAGDNIYVHDNYVHDCGPMTFTLSTHWYNTELSEYSDFTNIYETDNLLERCGAGVHWAALSEMDGGKSRISDFVFSGNIVMHTGEGWMTRAVDSTSLANYGFGSAVEDMYGPAVDEKVLIKDNIFYCSRQALVTLNSFNKDFIKVDHLADFSGNTYVQFSDAPFLAENKDDTNDYPAYSTYGMEKLKETVQDATGTFLEYPVYSEIDRAYLNGYMEEEIWKRPDNESISGTEYRRQLIRLISKYAPENIIYFETHVKNSDSLNSPCIKTQALMMNYYAAVALSISNYNCNLNPYTEDWGEGADLDAFPTCENRQMIFSIFGPWDSEFCAALCWDSFHASPVTSLSAIRSSNKVAYYGDILTVPEACESLTRLAESVTRKR